MDFKVVGIGASAGGLDACLKLVGGLPSDMAYILVQHLDPSHASMMVELLTGHTSLIVREAAEGMPVEAGHFYVIPPGTYLAVENGALHLSPPRAPHGARLPFDFLLQSIAEQFGPRAIGLILSGTGADGSLSLATIHKSGGHIIAQAPEEAGFDGMPRSAIATGLVDQVLSLADIPGALAHYASEQSRAVSATPVVRPDGITDRFSDIIELLRTQTVHDFTLYKRGTLQRRIERRMGLAAIDLNAMDRYLDVLRKDANELDLLAKDLLINVTSFFRDPKAFALLAEQIVPELLGNHTSDQALRIWVVGCSTGEETYSLAMLFREQISASRRNVKLQIFASDVDPDAVATAREGLYPETISANVSAERLGRFFSKEDHKYRVSPELRSSVVFTVQDVLADPPFSRMDFVSCRNLLIYLQPEAQAKALALFHFAIREGGILLLGSAETVGEFGEQFSVISKPNKLYRRMGRGPSGDIAFQSGGDMVRLPTRLGAQPVHVRQAALADLCRRLVMESYAPAAVLINEKHECLYFLGPTDRFLKIAPGYPMHDLLAMAREDVRTRLRTAIQQAGRENARVIISGGRVTRDGEECAFDITVQPALHNGEKLLLVCFVDAPKSGKPADTAPPPDDIPRIKELELELEATRKELQSAIRNLEVSGEEQKAVNEEALSVNEEYQSTNEELLTSKEELQSLNEELTALNSQLQETLERQKTTFNDLQNILYSTNVATLFLDKSLNIRFFTPATKSLFNVIPGDVGRPLADLTSLSADAALPGDVQQVLASLDPIEREIETQAGVWFLRRILPYRTRDDAVEGVVITFTDISERKQTRKALEAAKQQADLANTAKSRFLAAASHDLRQPLQTLSLLEGLLMKAVEGEKAKKLVGRFGQTLGSMAGILNTMLDINQIEAGVVRAERVDFRMDDLLHRLRDEFTYHAQTQKLSLRVVPCSLTVHSDPRLLEQMIRNLLANALKFTKTGKILLGVRRRKGGLSIEIWDTGVGIPDNELKAIFDEYHQLDNPARVRSQGLGLGLSIVQRLGNLLGHSVHVRSRLGKGSAFAIEIELSTDRAGRVIAEKPVPVATPPVRLHHSSAILIVEDDVEVRELLELLVRDEGYRAVVAPDGVAALELIANGSINPDLVLADFNLPNGMNGLAVTAKLREMLGRLVPVIILTGDISSSTLRDIADNNCVQLNKPVKLEELTQAIARLLDKPLPANAVPSPKLRQDVTGSRATPVIFIVDDDSGICDAMRSVLEDDGRFVETYPSSEAFLAAYQPGREACLLIDAYLPGMNGLDLLKHLADAGDHLPAIMITGNSDVQMAVQAMKAGAIDFIEKPIGAVELKTFVERAFEQSRDVNTLLARREEAARHVASLTPRQREIMALVLAGHPSKNIAADLGISQRTVENHRAEIMTRMGAKSLPALARQALAAGD